MEIKTACPLDCYDSCSMIATVEDGRVQRLDGDMKHSITKGNVCSRGRKLRDRLYSDYRILKPQKKVNGQWQEISWQQAYSEISDKIKDTIHRFGHHAILHAYDWGSGTVLKNLNQRFFYLLGGCTETVGSLCWDAGIEAQRYDFGQARCHAPEDHEKSKAIVVWGRNVSVTNMHMMPYIKQAKRLGCKLIQINPLKTDLDQQADMCIAPRPGTDGALALGVLNHCFLKGWIDRKFITEHSIGWEEFKNQLNQFSLEFVSAETDVPIDQIIALAEIYGKIHPVTTLLGIGLQRYLGGGNAIRSIDALVAATGHVGVSGGGVNYANRWVYQFLNQSAITQRDLADVREFQRGLQARQILESDPKIQMLFVTRTNPLVQVPNSGELKRAYEAIPCKIVIDMFMTPTAEIADYFLPCTNVLEDEDFVFTTMWHSMVTYIHQAVKPLGDAKPDWRIFADLAKYLGFANEMNKPIHEWMDMVLSPLHKQGITIKELIDRGTIKIPIADVPWNDFHFETPSGKYEFSSDIAGKEGQSRFPIYIAPLERTLWSKVYPYPLLTIHPRKHENSQQPEFPKIPDLPIVEIHQSLAYEKNIKNGDKVRVWNDQSSVMAISKLVTTGHRYSIKLESGWWGQGITSNHFTKSHMADLGQQTAQYDCTCNIERIGSGTNE